MCLFRLREKWDSNKNVTEELNCWSRSSSSYLLVFVGFSKSIGNKKKKVIRSHTHTHPDRLGSGNNKKGKEYIRKQTDTYKANLIFHIYLFIIKKSTRNNSDHYWLRLHWSCLIVWFDLDIATSFAARRWWWWPEFFSHDTTKSVKRLWENKTDKCLI